MNAEEALDRVYTSTPDPASQKALYDGWADSYDHDLEASGYATPSRVAEVLAQHLDNRDAPILDFGCGTGMSGRAMAAAGFTTIDGADLSRPMLDRAEQSGVYRRLWQLTPDQLEVSPGDYRAAVACGVISVGAAPSQTLSLLASSVGPGDLLVFSYNDHTLEDSDYLAVVNGLLNDEFEQLAAVHGVHIASRGSESTIFVLRRRDATASS